MEMVKCFFFPLQEKQELLTLLSVQGDLPSDLKLPHLQWILHVVLFWTEAGERTQGLSEFLGGAQPEPRLVSGPWSLAERQCNWELFCSPVFQHRLFLFACMCDGCEAHSSCHFYPCRELSPSSCLAPHRSLSVGNLLHPPYYRAI